MRFALVLLATVSPAAAQPTRNLEMRYLRAENLHIANQRGAINWHDEITLELELRPNGKLAATETGKARKHDLHVRGKGNSSSTTEDLQQWKHKWSGTWKLASATLALDVVLDSRTCTHVLNSSDAPQEKKTCGTVSKQIHFDCTTEQVSVYVGAVKTTRAIWQCFPAGNVDLDRTPRGWTFGKTSCVRQLGGMSGMSYDVC